MIFVASHFSFSPLLCRSVGRICTVSKKGLNNFVSYFVFFWWFIFSVRSLNLRLSAFSALVFHLSVPLFLLSDEILCALTGVAIFTVEACFFLFFFFLSFSSPCPPRLNEKHGSPRSMHMCCVCMCTCLNREEGTTSYSYQAGSLASKHLASEILYNCAKIALHQTIFCETEWRITEKLIF